MRTHSLSPLAMAALEQDGKPGAEFRFSEGSVPMINSAKVEVDMDKALDAGNGTGFLQIEQEPPK